MSTRSSLGSTELADLDLCERLYWLRHVRGLVPLETKRGRFLGTLLHVCLRYWYGAHRVGGPPSWYFERSLHEELNRVGSGEPKYVAEALALFDRYVAKYGAADERDWRVLHVEEEFRMDPRAVAKAAADAPGFAGFLATATPDDWPSVRFDIVIETAGGARPGGAVGAGGLAGTQYVFDYKSEIGQWGKLAKWAPHNAFGMLWQPMEYLWIARHLRDATGALVFPRMADFWIQRVQTVDPFEMDRHPIQMTRRAYDETPQKIIRQLMKRRRIRADLESGVYGNAGPPGSYWPWTCVGKYGLCDFYHACRSDDIERALSNPALFKRETEVVV